MSVSPNIGISIRHPDRLYIGGEWVVPHSGQSLKVISPETETLVATVAAGDATDVDRAVAAARLAFDEGPWPTTPPLERARILRLFGEALKARSEEFAAAWTAQIGGLLMLAPHAAAHGHDNILNAAKLGEQFAFEESADSYAAGAARLVREPVGVVAAIAPWNAAYMLMTAKLGPALMAGCTVVMKPAPETPLEVYVIAECAEEVGLPAGVINFVTADREASDTLLHDRRVDKISFTGSTEVGRRIASVCGDRLARVTLELGGKSAALVLDDYPVEEAAKLLTTTISMVSGQVCAMLSRVIVSRERHDALADAIAAEMAELKIGYSSDPETQMGSLASARQLERVEAHIARARDEGAELMYGGKRPAHLSKGSFIEPTLFVNVDNKSSIAQNEVFGPVMCLIPCDDLDDGIRIANDSAYGLHGAVLTNDAQAAYRVGKRIRTGSFAHNGLKVDFALPFGGVKQSGMGREGGVEGLRNYLETKAMLLDAAPVDA